MYESELREILPTHQPRSIKEDQQSTETEVDFWEFLLMVGFGNIDATKEFFQSLRKDITAGDWRLALVDIGEAKFLALSGQQLKSFIRLKYIEKSIFSEREYPNINIYHEIIALYTYTLSSLQENISTDISTFLLHENGKRLTKNKKFKLAFEYRLATSRVTQWQYPISHLVDSIRVLEKNNLDVLASIGYRAAGMLFRESKDYKSAYECYDLAMNTSLSLNLSHNLKHILIAKAFAQFSEGKTELAENTFHMISLAKAPDPFLPLLNENLALIAKSRDKMDLSVSLVKSALDISSELDSVSRVPGECEYLGDAYENHYKDYEQAEYYYKLGYDASMRYAAHGISLTGDRKKAVEAYTNFISRKTKSSSRDKPKPGQNPFRFAQGKSWTEIKDTFQHQLILYHGNNQKSGKLIAKKLDMPPSTLYSLQDRLKDRGYSLTEIDPTLQKDEHHLQNYVMEHEDLSWVEVNQIFEREMMHYLYEKYGYNKHRLANILELSYPSIISKTRELTKVNDHFLKN